MQPMDHDGSLFSNRLKFSSLVSLFTATCCFANTRSRLEVKPWYRRFNGLIEKSAEKETGVTYTTSGIIKVHNNDLIITKLPIHRWTAVYNNFLDSLTGRINLIMVKREYSDDAIVHFEVNLSVTSRFPGYVLSHVFRESVA